MKLTMGSFPVREVAFGRETRWDDGRLEIDRDAVLAAVRRDLRIARAELELVRPGESARIWPVRDVVEPRIKVEGPGVCYPGICGRSIETVGRGRTHRLAGVGVVEVSDTSWHDAGGDHLSVFLDTRGPWADLVPTSQLQNVCLVVEADRGLGIHAQNQAVHNATLIVADELAAAVKDLDPPETEDFELTPTDPSLPRVVYLWGLHSPQAMSGSADTFCTATYGLTQLTPPWLVHPNEVLDGAVTGPYRTPFAMSWTVQNNPILLDLYRRHGRDWSFAGCVFFRTEWTTQQEKLLMANQTAKMADLLGAQGAVVTWDAGGNEFIEVIRAIQACERLGIKTVFVTSEDNPAGGAPTLLEPLPEADAIVSTGFFSSRLLDIEALPPVERVIGWTQKYGDARRTELVDVAGPLPPPGRYDDHYGFNRLSCFAY